MQLRGINKNKIDMSRTVIIREQEDAPIPPDPGVKKIPVRIDSKTVILVREGADIEEKRRRYKERSAQPPNMYFW